MSDWRWVGKLTRDEAAAFERGDISKDAATALARQRWDPFSEAIAMGVITWNGQSLAPDFVKG